MGEPNLRLEGAEDRSYVETLLARNDLPSLDVADKFDCFYVGYHETEPVGIGGIEPYDNAGLLRSVVVEASARGEGFGTALCEKLEQEANENGIETLYLLTTTAADFFAAQGYTEVPRDDAPAAIQETTEFTELCPTTATCMRKSL